MWSIETVHDETYLGGTLCISDVSIDKISRISIFRHFDEDCLARKRRVLADFEKNSIDVG